MNSNEVSNAEAVLETGPSAWSYVIVAGQTQARGTVQAVDPRDALSRTLTLLNSAGVMYGNALGISVDALADAPANATEEYTLIIAGGTVKVRKVKTPLTERLASVMSYLRAEHRLKVNTDFAYTLKYGKVNILCAAVFESTIREGCELHDVVISSMHTYP